MASNQETLSLLLESSTPPKVIETATTLFIGYLCIWGLFGVLSAQVYLFYIAFPKELPSRLFIVYGLYCFELAQVIMLTVSGVQTFGTGWGNPAALDHIGTIFVSVPLMTSIIAWIVQAFYAYRIGVLAETKWPPILVLFVATIGLGGGIATSVIGGQAQVFSRFLGRSATISTAFWNGGAALCDILIALLMIYYLSKRSIGIWKSTQDRVSRVIRLVIETGTLTALIAILNLVLSCLPAHPSYFQITSSILSKLYSNSMMVMLNSRMKIGRLVSDDVLDEESGGKRTTGQNARPFRNGQARKNRRAISTLMFKSGEVAAEAGGDINPESDLSGTRLVNESQEHEETETTSTVSQSQSIVERDWDDLASRSSRIAVVPRHVPGEEPPMSTKEEQE